MTAHVPQAGTWYLTAMEHLVGVVRDLSQARDLDRVTAIVRDAARALTGADGATFVLRDNDLCYYAEENAIAPLWKGRRFPIDACISGWAMLNGQTAIIEDIYADPRIPAEAYQPTFVKSLAMVPIRRTAPIGAIGNYWATHRLPTAEEVALLEALADTVSVAIENCDLYARLRRQLRTLKVQHARISQQHASLEVFTHALAHDLREPIRTLGAFSGLLREGPDAPDRNATYLRYIQDATARVAVLMDAVSRFTQLDTPAPLSAVPCDLADAVAEVRDVLGPLLASRQARLDCTATHRLHIDRVQLVQLLEQLVANAVIHNPRPVTITIGAATHGGRTEFFVRDDGIGVPAAQAEQVFLPFRRLGHDTGCAGLGLTICRRIVALHGGEIRCEAAPGPGALFVFTLPDALRAAEPHAGPGPSPAPALANLLVVDDREADLELIRIALLDRARMRCNLHTARDGREAHSLLADARTRIDLVLLDINMPDVNGFELLEQMRGSEALARVPVIMCTGSDRDSDRRRAAALGAAGYLMKPPSFSQLKDIVSRLPSLDLTQDSDTMRLVRTTA